MGRSTRKVVEGIFGRAYDQAVGLVAKDIQAALPEGWRVVLAVGWGVTVFDAQGRMVKDARVGLSARLKRALANADWLEETVGLGNERITREAVTL